MNKSVLIGAISGDYTVDMMKPWEVSSRFDGVDRVIFIYKNKNQEVIKYLLDNNVTIIEPDFDFYGNKLENVESNSGVITESTARNLVHNLRFFHISWFLETNKYDKVIITDVRDLIFNHNPFDIVPTDKLLASSEYVTLAEDDGFNRDRLFTVMGNFINTMLDKEVYCCGVVAGGGEVVKNLCRDIYLLCIGRKHVDQQAYTYLIHTSYKSQTIFSKMEDNFVIHLAYVANGKVKFDINKIKEFAIVHQYDRLNSSQQKFL